MDQFTEAFKQLTGLDATLYGAAVMLALLLRFGRASFRWMDDPHTVGAALGLGVAGALLSLNLEHHAWGWIGMQSLSLAVAVMIAERILRGLSSKLPFLPADNSWVKPEPPNRP